MTNNDKDARIKIMRELKSVHSSLFCRDDEGLTPEELRMVRGASVCKRICICHSRFSKMHRSVLMWILCDDERRRHSHQVLSLSEIRDIQFGNHPTYQSLSSLRGKYVVIYFGDEYKTKGMEESLVSLTNIGLNEGIPIVFFFVGTRQKLETEYGYFLKYLASSQYILCDLARAKDWCERQNK